MTIYDRIKELRISKKMTQTDLALKMGYKDGSMITKIESGKVDISQKKIMSFAKALDTTPAYLMGWTEDDSAFERYSKYYFDSTDATKKLGFIGVDEADLISGYRSLSPHGQSLLIERCEELKLLYGKKTENNPAESV